MNEQPKFFELLSTFNQGDIAFIKSILMASGIDFHVEGEYFLQVRPLVCPAKFMVEAPELNNARELLKEFRNGSFGYSP